MAVPVVALIDDQPEAHDVVRSILGVALSSYELREYVDAGEAESALSDTSWNDVALVVLDLRLPIGSGTGTYGEFPGLDLLRAIVSTPNHPPVIIWSGFEQKVVGTDRAHADLVIGKLAVQELSDAIVSILAGIGFRSRSIPRVSDGMILPSSSLFVDIEWTIGIMAASSLWVAAQLQVTSPCSTGENSLLVALSLCLGALLALARMTAGPRRAVLGAIGIGGLTFLALVLPNVSGRCS